MVRCVGDVDGTDTTIGFTLYAQTFHKWLVSDVLTDAALSFQLGEFTIP